MAQRLLQRNRRDASQPGILLMLLQGRQHLAQVLVVEPFLLVVVRIGLLTQGPIVHETDTSEGSSKLLLLLVSWRDSVPVCSLLFHELHDSIHGVKHQQYPPNPSPKQGLAYLPMPEGQRSYARKDKRRELHVGRNAYFSVCHNIRSIGPSWDFDFMYS